MARINLKTQLEESRKENAQLRALCANYAHVDKCNKRTIMMLKSRLASRGISIFRTGGSPSSFSEKAIAYCKEHDCKCVPANVVAEWRANND